MNDGQLGNTRKPGCPGAGEQRPQEAPVSNGAPEDFVQGIREILRENESLKREIKVAREAAEITAQLGYGPTSVDPSIDPDSFTWLDAEYNPGAIYDNNDEYEAEIVESIGGVYAYAYRFSGDGGGSWLYCDWDPGTSDGFSVDQLGTLTVE